MSKTSPRDEVSLFEHKIRS